MCHQIANRRSCAILLVWVIAGLLVSEAWGQMPKIPYKNLGVDAIKTNQRQLFGFVLSRTQSGGIECAVDRQWLKTTYPDLATQVEDAELKSQIEVQQTLIGRIKRWSERCKDDKFVRLKLFLDDELNRISQPAQQAGQSVFVLLNLPPADVAKVTVAKADQRHIAGVAYKYNLSDITITASSELEKQLKERNVTVATETFDLTDKLPVLIRETENQWAARQALMEHSIVEAFELQGKDDVLMAAGDPIDATALLKQFSSAQDDLLRDLAKELKLDLGTGTESKRKDDWKAVAVKKAEQKNVNGVLVHRIEQKLGVASVKVVTDFLAKNANGEWFTVFHSEKSNDGSTVAKDELDRLQQDPNLKQILPMVEALGGKSQLENALRQGAATAAALGEARSAFQEFIQPHTRSLTSPPISLPRG